MDGSIKLNASQRKALLKAMRSGSDVRGGRRAHMVLLAADGWSYRRIREALLASFDFISAALASFRSGGVPSLVSNRAEESGSDEVPDWLPPVVDWLQNYTPRDFSFFRTRWSCDTLRQLLWWEEGVRISAETIRRQLKRLGFVWRRPRPVVRLKDPEYESKLKQLRRLLHGLAEDETAVFQDEVDVKLNPEIGSCWTLRGEQAEVLTPGNNQKRYVAGSLNWRTGRLLVSEPGTRRNSTLFIEHLEDLRRRLRSYKVIHVVADNASFHDSRAVKQYLEKHASRIKLHFLPKYAPETNPIERVWWRLRDTITRNHRQPNLEALLQQTYEWFNTKKYFNVNCQAYNKPK